MDTITETEAALIRLAQSGDEVAFTTLFNTHFTTIHNYLLRRMYESPDAEDVAIEVFTRAWSAPPSYTITTTPFRGWLFRIAHNCAETYRKAYKRRNEVEWIDVVPSQANTETMVIERLVAADIVELVKNLTPLQQSVIRLRFLQGLTLAETAERVGSNSNAVKALQHYAVGI